MVSFMIQPLYPLGERALVSTRQETEWALEPAWMWWGREKSLPLPGTKIWFFSL